MEQRDIEEVNCIITTMLMNFPINKDRTQSEMRGLIELWIAAIADMPIEQIRKTCVRFTREHTEFPTIAAFRKCAGIVPTHRMTDEERATIGWEQVLQAIRQYGHYESVDFQDGVINAAIRLVGGWDYMCVVETQDVPFRRMEFVKAYQIVVNNGIGDSSPHLGFFDRTNGKIEYMRYIESKLPRHEVEGKLNRVQPALEGPAQTTKGVEGQQHAVITVT